MLSEGSSIREEASLVGRTTVGDAVSVGTVSGTLENGILDTGERLTIGGMTTAELDWSSSRMSREELAGLETGGGVDEGAGVEITGREMEGREAEGMAGTVRDSDGSVVRGGVLDTGVEVGSGSSVVEMTSSVLESSGREPRSGSFANDERMSLIRLPAPPPPVAVAVAVGGSLSGGSWLLLFGNGSSVSTTGIVDDTVELLRN